MADLVHCIYTSVQTHVLKPAELDALMQHSRDGNELHGITGILLHIDNTFFQVLEGPRQEVDQLYRKILSDPRHTRITQIIYESIAKRFFGDSTMSLAVLSPREFSAALNESSSDRAEELLAHLDEGRAKRLLRAFGQGRWRARMDLQARERLPLA